MLYSSATPNGIFFSGFYRIRKEANCPSNFIFDKLYAQNSNTVKRNVSSYLHIQIKVREAQMVPSYPASPFITMYTQYVTEDTQRLFISARLIGTKEIRLAYLANNNHNLKKSTIKSESDC